MIQFAVQKIPFSSLAIVILLIETKPIIAYLAAKVIMLIEAIQNLRRAIQWTCCLTVETMALKRRAAQILSHIFWYLDAKLPQQIALPI